MAKRALEEWLEAYGRDHQHPVNKRLHYACVPVIVISLVGLLWSLPVPAMLAAPVPAWSGLALNWGSALLLVAVAWYALLSIPLAAGMLVSALLVMLLVGWLDSLPVPLWQLATLMFLAAWTGQFIGHWYEGARPSFLRDLTFLMIGPLWLLASLYRRLGLRY